MAIDSLPVGNVKCDYISRAEFIDLCKKWLNGQEQHHIVTLNPEMVVEASRNKCFARNVQEASIRVPDGAGLIWARWYLRSPRWTLIPSLMLFPFVHTERITGVDAIDDICRICAGQDLSVYLLGGTTEEAKATAKRLRGLFPSLKLHIAPPHLYDPNGPEPIISLIKKAQPSVLLVAYGAVKQTQWIQTHCLKIPSIKIAMGVGGAFAILGEHKRRAPSWLLKHNFEWLWRLLLEPSRLPRIYNATIVFPHLIKHQKQRSLVEE